MGVPNTLFSADGDLYPDSQMLLAKNPVSLEKVGDHGVTNLVNSLG